MKDTTHAVFNGVERAQRLDDIESGRGVEFEGCYDLKNLTEETTIEEQKDLSAIASMVAELREQEQKEVVIEPIDLTGINIDKECPESIRHHLATSVDMCALLGTILSLQNREISPQDFLLAVATRGTVTWIPDQPQSWYITEKRGDDRFMLTHVCADRSSEIAIAVVLKERSKGLFVITHTMLFAIRDFTTQKKPVLRTTLPGIDDVIMNAK